MQDDFYAEMESKWGKRGARGLKGCVHGKETLAFGTTGLMAPEERAGHDVHALQLQELAEQRLAVDAGKRAREKGGSRAAQRRKKKAGGEALNAASMASAGAASDQAASSAAGAEVAEAPKQPAVRNAGKPIGRSPKPAGGPAFQGEPAPSPKPGQPASAGKRPKPLASPKTPGGGDDDEGHGRKKAKKGERPHSLFAMSPSEHVAKDEPKAGVPRCLGEELWIRDTIIGDKDAGEATPGSKVSVLYTARLHDTKKRFDHRTNPNLPFVFTLGAGTVVEGFDRGILGMRVGGEREIVIPPPLGYGVQGRLPKIPPNAPLHFYVKLEPNEVKPDEVVLDRAAANADGKRRPRGARGGGRGGQKKRGGKTEAQKRGGKGAPK
ncbi:hypothetical protein M885DRAFT_550994 [Pelagophyceae sp. CCMP2097]|nr:hypothetical protein M885DRAFT_550994 [Pelagophyceae sp. CCMP2097]|mmetsp:Transcript_23063/g.78867  ORF Transcript_23063/g.78867 Transcript_23063/m.78867 type:complete len:380 (-) Transcript_23063:72-1211(-)